MTVSGRKSSWIFIVVLTFSLLLTSCENGQTAPGANEKPAEPATTTPLKTPAEEPVGFLRGVSLSPRSYQEDDFPDFFAKAGQAGEIVSWVGDWKEIANPSGGPFVLAGLADTYAYTPLVEVQFFHFDTEHPLQPLDEPAFRTYRESVVVFIQQHPVHYLGIGVEINALDQVYPVYFEAFVRLFDEIYDAVKAVSPETVVFTVFQLERMKGLNGGLFGGENDPAEAQWELLDRFPKSDIIAFTSYPGIIFKTPAEIPADYYTEIAEHTDKTVAFTELGWQSDSDVPGWPSTPADQAEFVSLFFDLTTGLDKEMVIWSFLFDPPVGPPFDYMGLFDDDNTPRPAWDAWLGAQRGT